MKLTTKYMVCVLVSISLLLLTGCFLPYNTQAKGKVLPILPTQSDEEKLAAAFLQQHLQDKNNVLVYSVNKAGLADYAVSESMGQAMEYAALSGNKAYFSQAAQLVDKYFLDPSGYYYWKIAIPGYKGTTSSALVDDLRIFKAYKLAQQQQFADYQEIMEKLAARIAKFDINNAGYPCDYYDGSLGKPANEVSLFYLDSQTFAMLAEFDKRNWSNVRNNVDQLLLNMPSNRFGFYPAKYNISTEQYIWGETINMVENLYTALNLNYAGGNVQPLIKFMQKQIRQNGKISNWYYLNGSESDPNESTAVYALAARLFALNGYSTEVKFCYRKVIDFQITENSPFIGGFGDADSGMVYAFDQLEALLMLRMVEDTDE